MQLSLRRVYKDKILSHGFKFDHIKELNVFSGTASLT